jgi:hypothetical protein
MAGVIILNTNKLVCALSKKTKRPADCFSRVILAYCKETKRGEAKGRRCTKRDHTLSGKGCDKGKDGANNRERP